MCNHSCRGVKLVAEKAQHAADPPRAPAAGGDQKQAAQCSVFFAAARSDHNHHVLTNQYGTHKHSHGVQKTSFSQLQ